MNFFPSRVKKHTKLTENKLFRTILTQKNPPSSNVKQKNHTRKMGKIPAKLQETKKNRRYYKDCRNLVQNSEIKVTKKKNVYVYICERVLSSNYGSCN